MGSSTSVIVTTERSNEEKIADSSKAELTRRMSVSKAKHHILENLVAHGELDRDYHEFYVTSEEDDLLLGKGNSGKVKLCTHKITGIPYALKSVSKVTEKEEDIDKLRDEIEIMSELNHPNIVRIQEYFETADNIYLIIELCPGGDLQRRLKEEKNQHFSEQKVRDFAYSMFSAVRYIHSCGILHRDISLENFLCDNVSENTTIKLIDFGVAGHFAKHITSASICRKFSVDGMMKGELVDQANIVSFGRRILYMAPEVINGDLYEPKSDVWSLGVCLYKLLSDKYPFRGINNFEVIDEIHKANIPKLMQHPSLDNCSANVKAFITKCLERSVVDRFTAEEALLDDWFVPCRSTKGRSISLKTLERLQAYPRRGSLEKISREAIAQSLPAAQLENMREEFNKIDTDRQGMISVSVVIKSILSHREFANTDVESHFINFQTHIPGMLSYHEFVAALLPTDTISEINLQMAFEKIAGHKENISKAEMTELLGLSVSSSFNAEKLWQDAGMGQKEEMDFEDFRAAVLKSISMEETASLKAKRRQPSRIWSGSLLNES